ncbi:hypothetical protein DPMN_084328 [Dreissena polymorpha]|uniref:Uncharacterized protein n=1 Tax=Dreissena polymorpha TaxID=45954 RepID=A0A9D4BKR9_DREPO|nr:hypothetical protein DPMN_084328 [Dreissena polymorpha]
MCQWTGYHFHNDDPLGSVLLLSSILERLRQAQKKHASKLATTNSFEVEEFTDWLGSFDSDDGPNTAFHKDQNQQRSSKATEAVRDKYAIHGDMVRNLLPGWHFVMRFLKLRGCLAY